MPRIRLRVKLDDGRLTFCVVRARTLFLIPHGGYRGWRHC
jgi:hypothetical protein